jgi:ABC-2 type transport system ATP-binding protein
MIEVRDLTKRYGSKMAVDHLTFQVQPGRVTGFLGPNGAGKSTTMRVILGLDAPTGGQATIAGRPYASLSQPLRRVGSLLDGKAMHGGRTAYNHLLWMSQSNGIPRSRVDEVLEMVGLSQVSAQRTKGFSLGMGQRLGIASALLGDPEVLLLDEPGNGLDTEGIRWIRDLMKGLAIEGRTVLLSSHLMSEMELTADHLVVIGQGRLIADTSMRAFIQHNSQPVTVVRSPEIDKLRTALERVGGRMQLDAKGGWRVSGPDAATIGDVAAAQGIVLHELTPRMSSLEDVYTQMTKTSVEYRGGERVKAHPVSTGREA